MKNDYQKNKPEQEEIKVPKGAERFTVIDEQNGKYIFGKLYDFDGLSYRLAAVMKNGDGVSLEFVRVQ